MMFVVAISGVNNVIAISSVNYIGYEGAIVTEVKGLTEAEMSTLKAFGAVEVNLSCSMPINFR